MLLLLLIAIVASVGGFAASGLTVDPWLFTSLPVCAITTAGALVLHARGRVRWLTRFTLYNNYLGLVGAAGVLATYAAGTTGRPFADAALIAADRALGYDWRSYAAFYADHSWAADLILPGYQLIYIMPMVVIASLVAIRQEQRIELYLTATLMTIAATIILFALFPARTAWGATGVPLEQVRAFRYLPLPDQGWENDLLQLRGGVIHQIARGSGLVAFLSLHCATALLCGWAAWPLRRWRWPLLAIDAAAILATPIYGGHYMTDLVGGAIVATAALWGAYRLMMQPLPSYRAATCVITGAPSAVPA